MLQAGGGLAESGIEVEAKAHRIDGHQRANSDQRGNQTIFDCSGAAGVGAKGFEPLVPLTTETLFRGLIRSSRAARRVKNGMVS